MTELEPVSQAVVETRGEVFTRRWVVELILDLVGYDAARDLAHLAALEPSCGAGAFLVPMVERLSRSLRSHGLTLSDAADAITGYDLAPTNVARARAAVAAVLVREGWSSDQIDLVVPRWIVQRDFLLSDAGRRRFDFVVGNPPYIRLEDVSPSRSQAYRSACATMTGRSDVFIGFYEVALRLLKPRGRLGFICADRWMRNAYGERLRGLITSRFAVDLVLSMHDVDAFEEPVSAYPAITVLSANAQGRAVVGDANREFGPASAEQLLKWIDSDDSTPLARDGLSAAWLPSWFDTTQGWPSGSPERLALVAELERTFAALEDDTRRTKIGIGIATGADAVYITSNPDVVEPDRLLPLVMGDDLRSGSVEWSGHYLVNPWHDDGLVDLRRYPKLAAYFAAHAALLKGRATAQKNHADRWYRTIDRVTAGLREKPKLLFRDMGSRICPVLDDGSLYPHHNLYWVASSEWDLPVLGGLLLSDLADLFVSTYCVRMRGGTLRFQAQYLRRIRVPQFSAISAADRERLADAFGRRDAAAATRVALRLYGVEAVPA